MELAALHSNTPAVGTGTIIQIGDTYSQRPNFAASDDFSYRTEYRIMPFANRFVLPIWFASCSWAFAQSPAGKTEFNVADRLAIQNVISSHFLNLDSSQIDAWIANYAEEATFVAVIAGKRYESPRPVFEKFFRERFRKFRENGDQRRHLVSNILFVDQSDEAAHIEANGLLLTTNRGGKPELVGGLTYEGWFVKREGVWKIKKWAVRGDTNIEIEGAEEMQISEDATK